MKKKLFKDLLTSIDQAREIRKNLLICPNCKRELPNNKYKTSNGCIWCINIPKSRFKISREQLYQAYFINHKKLNDIIKEFNVSQTTIIRLLKTYNIPKRGKFIACYGQTKKDSKGYILVLNPNHPYAQKRGYIPEHRLVMEKHLGRYLTKEEVVHHKNEIKNDNRIENLKLFPNKKTHNQYHSKMRRNK